MVLLLPGKQGRNKKMERTVLKGEPRDSKSFGSVGSKRIRQSGGVPANLYGHGIGNVCFTVSSKELHRLVDQGHHLVTIDIEGKSDIGLMKEVQFDPFGDHIIHVDFARVDLDEVIVASIELVVQGIPKGVGAGGTLDVAQHEIPIRGKAGNLPEHIVVVVDDLEIGDSIRASELSLPEGMETTLPDDAAIVIVHGPTLEEIEAEVDAAVDAEAGDASEAGDSAESGAGEDASS